MIFNEGKIIINNQEIKLFDLLVKNTPSTFNISIKENLENLIQIYKNSGVYSLSKDYKMNYYGLIIQILTKVFV